MLGTDHKGSTSFDRLSLCVPDPLLYRPKTTVGGMVVRMVEGRDG